MPVSTSRASGAVRAAVAGFFLSVSTASAAQWAPLAKDGIHDPAAPALRDLQDPGQALSRLPRDSAGNGVDWMRALNQRSIEPRSNLYPDTNVRLLDQDILLNLRGGMPIVRFPHRSHTQWLDCANCHEKPFQSKTGANRLSMFEMLQGEQCGVCHGAVAFPLTECSRCHNTPRGAGVAK